LLTGREIPEAVKIGPTVALFLSEPANRRAAL
jgi:hypothetical protein